MTQRGIRFDRREKRDQKRKLRGSLTATHRNTLNKGRSSADLREDLLHAKAMRHGRCLLLALAEAGVALLAVTLLPPDAPGMNGQRIVRTVGHAVTAVVAAADRPRVVAGFTTQVTSLQEKSQAAARPVHAGERDNLTN